MTWHWSFDDSNTDIELWDHSQDPSTDTPVATRSPPDGASGWSWTGDYPDTVLDAMHSEATDAVATGDIPRAVAITLDMAGEQIDRYAGDSSGGAL
jgi:hypothetical protein